MQVVYSEHHRDHYPEHFLKSGERLQNPELPERAERLLQAVEHSGRDVVAPEDYGPGPLADVHTPEYLAFLQTIYERWQALDGASPEVIPNIHPNGRRGGYPRSPVGLAGYHQADTACPVGEATWAAARISANCAVHAAELVLADADSAYALCRPPGHHAFADMAGGFCYLNNTAIAAQRLLTQCDRVAILDVDLHHGNGTQSIFYRRPDVLTVSLHADPADFYPFFWGYADERGAGEGLGYNLNLPLPLGTGDDDYLDALDEAIERIECFAPDMLVVALGLDAFAGDPLAGLRITREGFSRIGAAIGERDWPCVLVQEGGYLSADLGPNLLSFLDGFEQARG